MIVEVLVILVELSTTKTIVAAIRVSILSHHEYWSIMYDPKQLEQLAEVRSRDFEDGFIVAPGVMLATASNFGGRRVDPSGYY